MPSISIALATYNGETFLPEQLQSLVSQRRRPDEVIIVDDSSSDATGAIIDDFARTAPFPVIRYRNVSRLGWRGNFIRAASLCRHALISFCDQDDVWYDHKLLDVETYFSDPDTLLVHHNADLIDRHGGQLGQLDIERTFPPFQSRLSRPTSWANPLGLTMTFRRSLLAFAPFWPRSVDPTSLDSPAAHDQFFYRLAVNLGNVRYIPEPLLAYRQHGHNAVGFAHGTSKPWDEMQASQHLKQNVRMLTGFCDLLADAQAKEPALFRDVLGEALEQNRSYLQHFNAGHQASSDPSLIRRATHFARLLRLNASTSGQWRLGKKVLLTTSILGVLLGR